MSKLKFKLYNEGNIVIFRILEQSRDITCLDSDVDILEFVARNGISILSSADILLTKTDVYLRGCDDFESPLTVEYAVFDDESSAKKHVEMYLEALREWRDKGYFSNSTNLAEGNTQGIYEF